MSRIAQASALVAILLFAGAVGAFAQGDYPPPEYPPPVLLPLVPYTQPPTPTPTATPLPTPTPLPCAPRPHSRDASRVVLSLADIPVEYGMDVVEDEYRQDHGDVSHSYARREFEATGGSPGPLIIANESVVLCHEEYARMLWPVLVAEINSHVEQLGTPLGTEIKVGEQNHSRYVYYGWFVYYVTAFRHDNIVTVLQAAGFSWIMSEGHMRDLARRLESRID